ncbi:MAG: hypothetical protein IJA17_00790 [Oscillospiraceae bacterium]|nr:hypothetical protein [Oscillospiraceae bacterium]
MRWEFLAGLSKIPFFRFGNKKQPGGKSRMKTVADPERRRWRIGTAIRSVGRFSPLQGDSVCGSKLQGYKFFFSGVTRFLLIFQKKRGGIKMHRKFYPDCPEIHFFQFFSYFYCCNE